MNNVEAREVLKREMAPYRQRSYEELCRIAEKPKRTFEASGASGTRYQIDVVVYWDAEPNGSVRVIGCIDDGSWRAFLPLKDSFIKATDGSFVGEPSN